MKFDAVEPSGQMYDAPLGFARNTLPHDEELTTLIDAVGYGLIVTCIAAVRFAEQVAFVLIILHEYDPEVEGAYVEAVAPAID